MPRHLWRTILRLLRPAEAAARRLIIAAARGIVVPPRLCRTPSPSAQVEGKRGIAAARSPSPLWGGVRGGGQIQKLALPLFDPPRRIAPRRMAPRDLPRICVPGWTARLPVPLRLAPSPDDPISAARLALRLDALARALDDLPAQARRFARLKARLDAAASSPPSIGGEVVCAANRSGGRSLQVAAPGRFRRLSPLRGGPPPGCRLARYDPTPAHRRRHDIREIDEILAHAHELAIEALDRPDTS